MNRVILIILCSFVFLGGCGVKVVPQPLAGSQVDPSDGSVTQQLEQMSLTVRVQDLEVRPYQMVENLTSFWIGFDNSSNQGVPLSLDGFYLVDGGGNQMRPVTPKKVHEMIARDSFYLIPYPYVGFYYLQDAVRVSRAADFDSSLPYFPQRFPQDLYTQALPEGVVLPGGRVSGLVYFVADLTRMKSFELRYFLPGTPLSEDADFRFPFSVEKN
ncbi:hypothetical protein SAMN05660860_01910 [Geoalkalibacter ferrihydriticus]|uniref:Lipoprotein n=2 Tax=Geoalkalibacter ferrihydriticus TaxID=392333 RepID=A0A0C2EFP8_9BACT|nr:hypothetical protein [Geoalkalibacter ferrihydriticus]KIH77448.1 hypothetical protein GFER_01585 [Geoalkalibacter ferrihydriticus DSM 17813]SDM14632.1 hypothetical protein SAMN05660860_01910 [Geoalkalibacter ferrihydriticus]